jgi:hypothetical protein
MVTAKPGNRCGVGALSCAVVDRDARRHPPRKDRPGHRGRRNPDHQCPQNGATDIGLKRGHGEHRRRVRRNHRMHHAQSGEQRKSDRQQRRVGLSHHHEDERQQQDEADLKEDRNADDHRDTQNCPRHALRTKCRHERVGDSRRSTRLGHELAEHRPESDHDGDEPERGADTILQ